PPLLELRPDQRVACHHPENFADQAPQDTVLLSAAKEAVELVGDAVLEESAETSAAVASAAGSAAAPPAETPSKAAPSAE
ncbi:MAG TPA: peptide ABC transporter ATP-binding protein, partial [Streptomyces sp.]|nr:peptide ABC transporter ATP-binding protein [Streptomyces sp.]